MIEPVTYAALMDYLRRFLRAKNFKGEVHMDVMRAVKRPSAEGSAGCGHLAGIAIANRSHH